MKVRQRRWRDNAARLKEARYVSSLHKIGCTRNSSLAELMAANLHYLAQRKGFGRRLLDVLTDENLQQMGITRT